MRPRTLRRAVALGTAAALGLTACGGHHHTAAPAAPAPASSGRTTTTTTAAPPAAPRSEPLAPLTGLPVSAEAARRPAVVVKIDNVVGALPQSGVNQADVVYEEMVEGGLTRLAAVFASQQPTSVGPVRSGRLTDEGIADDLDHPVLAYAGTNGLFQPILASQPLADVIQDTAPSLFVRDATKAAPHNLYTTVPGLAALDKPPHPPQPLWAFRAAGSRFRGKGLARASGLSIAFPAASVSWTWDRRSKSWLRTQNGSVDTDAAGQRVSASNVVVEFVNYITSAYVTGEGAGANGSAIPTGEQTGSGTAWFLSDGSIVKGTWTRASLTDRAVYRDAAGRVIRLARGRTWVELAPAGTAPTVTP